MLSNFLSHAAIALMGLLGRLPLSWVRAVGTLLGWVLFALAAPRRRVAQTNLRMCFPDKTEQELRTLAMRTFVHFSQAWLDRGWLWNASPSLIRARLLLTGAVDELQGAEPVIIFAPHFVGLDAGWTALTEQLPRHFTTIYTHQTNKTINAWILSGRKRFGNARLFGRSDGVKTIVAALRQGDPLYLLPDMYFSSEESVFVPFYGVAAATVPSLSRFAKLGRAKVVPVVTRMTATGYEVQVLPAWQDFPTKDVVGDTALMNARLQSYIDTMPDQYFWVHKRFKGLPPGTPPAY